MNDRALGHFYYGDGKGKTTAAVGAALRMLGAGGKVLFVPFLKDGKSSETEPLRSAGAEFLIPRPILGFWEELDEEEQSAVKNAYFACINTLNKCASAYDLVVLDEAATAVSMGCLCAGPICDLINSRSAEILVTGHKFEKEIADVCDYVTEMRCISHPFKKGISARHGIEY